MREVALTTIDNPYDPIDKFKEWFTYDSNNGYNTCQYLARIARTSDQFSEEENDSETERAIDEIIKYGIAIDNKGNTVPYKKIVHT